MDSRTKTAISATLHCLTGCAIGEILGMVLGTALNLANGVTTLLAIVLAFLFGYGLTARSVLKYGVGLREALRLALLADTISIGCMEIVDNSIIWLVPGAIHATLNDSLFWGSLGGSLLIAFIATVPVNRWLIARGQGHAAVHRYHTHTTVDYDSH